MLEHEGALHGTVSLKDHAVDGEAFFGGQFRALESVGDVGAGIDD